VWAGSGRVRLEALGGIQKASGWQLARVLAGLMGSTRPVTQGQNQECTIGMDHCAAVDPVDQPLPDRGFIGEVLALPVL